MNAHVTVQDLKVLDDTPRVLDLRLAEALAYEQPIDIRKLIRRNQDELQKHGKVFATMAKTTPNGGRPGEEFWLNEAQSILVSMFSRTEKAAEVRRQIIEVFMAWRRGHLAPAGTMPFAMPAEGAPLQVYALQLETVRLAGRIHGLHAARALWNSLGLPPVPGHEPAKDNEAWDCLKCLLATPMLRARGGEIAATLGDAVRLGLDHATDDGDLPRALRELGILLVEEDLVGFAVANSHPEIEGRFAGTDWRKSYPYVLRRLPGARPYIKKAFGARQHRTTFIPESVLSR